MQIDEVLQEQSRADDSCSPDDVYYMAGALAPDPNGKAFRFFHDPCNARSYLVINREDVFGEIYRLTDLERAQNGFIKADVFRIGIRHGTKVKSVFMTIETIGETLSAEATSSPKAPGDCKHTSGCSSKCCTYGNDGKCYCDTCCIA